MATLPTKSFGTTKWETTRVGFGAWAVGGGGWSFGWGPQDDEASIAAIRHAVEHGVNWIDTAAAYGLGHSEEVVAKALEVFDERDRPYVFTKGGLVSDPENPMIRPARRRRSEESAQRVRGELAALARRSHRRLPDALAPERRHRCRDVLGGVPRVER